MSEKSDISIFIKGHRIKSGFKSQRSLADKSGISPATISRIESGVQKPNVETLRVLSNHLSTTSFRYLMIEAKYWDDDNPLPEYFSDERFTRSLILHLLEILADGQSKFPQEYHKDIFNIFGGYADDSKNKYSMFHDSYTFDTWYLNYLNASANEISDSDISEAIEEFDIHYNLETIRDGIINIDKRLPYARKTVYDFLEELEAFYDKYGLSSEPSLPSNINSVTPTTIKIPIIGTIACGDPILADENIIGYRNEHADNLPNGELYYVKAKGNSMEPTIPNGSFVLIREQPEVEIGQIAAVLVNDESDVTLKRVKKQGNLTILVPDNPNHEPMILTKDNPARILGRAMRYSQDL